jgi:hypothetical protein
MISSTIILGHKQDKTGETVYLIHQNPRKNTEHFQLIVQGQENAFFSTIKRENAQKYFDAIGTDNRVTI